MIIDDPDVVRGITELRRFKVKNHTTPEHRALHRQLIASLGGFYARNHYDAMSDESHVYPHFDANETAEGECLIDGLHEDISWTCFMYRSLRNEYER